jgi:hypothetical protein
LLKWNWGQASQLSQQMLNVKIRVLDNKLFWGILVGIYVILSLFFLNVLSVPTKNDPTTTILSSLDYFLPSYVHLFPIVPSLIMIGLILWLDLGKVNESRKKAIFFILTLIFMPLTYCLISIADYFHLATFTSSFVAIDYLISHIILGLTQILNLFGLALLGNYAKNVNRRARY